MVEKTYRVRGVGCEHCVRAITDEMTKIEEVETVTVDIPGKLVTVRHDGVSEAQIVSGVEEADYDVAGA